VDLIAHTVREAGKLVVCGVGKSGKIGRKIEATMNSLGIYSAFLHPTEALHGDLGLVRPVSQHLHLVILAFDGCMVFLPEEKKIFGDMPIMASISDESEMLTLWVHRMIRCFLSRFLVARRSCYVCSRIFLLQSLLSLSRRILSLMPVHYFRCMVPSVWGFSCPRLFTKTRKLLWVSVPRHRRQR
jgi:hypothetical protein